MIFPRFVRNRTCCIYFPSSLKQYSQYSNKISDNFKDKSVHSSGMNEAAPLGFVACLPPVSLGRWFPLTYPKLKPSDGLKSYEWMESFFLQKLRQAVSNINMELGDNLYTRILADSQKLCNNLFLCKAPSLQYQDFHDTSQQATVCMAFEDSAQHIVTHRHERGDSLISSMLV